MPAGVQHEAGLVGKLCVTVFTTEAFLFSMDRVVIVQVGPSLERGPTDVAHEWTVFRMHQTVPLQQLFVFETLVTHQTHIRTSLAVGNLRRTKHSTIN